jgi:hypothetical protein
MSTAKFDTLSTLDGSQSVPVNTVAQGSAKAWVNFNGTGTVAIRAAFNVTSITDAGTGTYNVNFTTALPDGNYAIGGCMDNSSGSNAYVMKNVSIANTASVAYVYSAIPGAAIDSAFCTFLFFR